MTGVFMLLAAMLGVLGIGRVKGLGPPERTQRTVKDNLAWAKHPRHT
jgi:hypothetical protein